ncbi:substrate-binding domain-containing protein [Klebsiella pneumoniae]|nr:substrate-binding domain-containing protein [Klebsiella pneumoniae]
MIMVNSLDNPYYASSQRCQRKSASSRLQNHRAVHGEDVQKAEMSLSAAIGKKCRALFSITLTPPPASPPTEKAKKAGIPVVLINREIRLMMCTEQITHNNFQAGSEVANVFVEEWRRRANTPS